MALTKVEAEQLQPAQTSITSVGTLTGLNTTGDITVTKSSARIRAIESGGATTQIAAGTATGYVGTYSNDPLQILSNSTAAITIDTSQSATFAGNIIGTDIKAAGSGGLTLQTDEGTKRLEILDNGNITVNHSSFSSLPTGSKLNIFGDGITLRLDGTSGTTKSILFRGTNVANPGEVYADGSLRFRTEDASTRITFHTNSSGSNNERMRIDSSGNVGIGTQTISATLDIVGGGASTAPTLELNSSTSTEFNHSINAFNANLTSGENNLIVVGREGSAKNSGYIGYKYNGAGSDTNLLTFGHWANDNIMNLSANGNLGIGTQTPAEKLHVEGSLLVDAFNAGSETGLFFREGFSSSNKYNQSILAYDHNGSSPDGISINAYDGISFCTGSNSRAEKMRIDSSGHVGINTGGTINGTGTRVLQVESTTSSALGPEVLIHNSGQGADAKAALTFGGKRSGNEGYTASIHTTNNDGMYFGTVAATNFSALPTTRMHIDEDGYITTPYQPSAAREVSSSIPNINCHTGGFFRIPFATSRHDQGGLHSYVSGNSANGSKFTAPVAGVYFYSCMVRIDGFSGNYFYLDMKVNGTTRQRHLDSETGSYLHRTVAGVYYLAAGDYITFEIANSGDTNVQVDNNTYMSMHLLG